MAGAALLAAPQAMAVEAGDANIYATGLKVNGNNVEFVLNAPGDVTINFYKGGDKVHSIVKENLAKGSYSISLVEEFPETLKTGDQLTWEVVATGAEKTAINGFSTYSSKVAELSGGDVSKSERENVNADIWTKAAAAVESDDQKMEYPYSIAVDKCPTSPNFGNIYVLNDLRNYYGSDTYGTLGFPKPAIEREGGVFVYNSNLNLQNETPYTDGLNAREGNFGVGVPVAPYAIAVDEEGYVFVSNNSGASSNGGIYVASPTDISSFSYLITVPSGNYFQDLVVVGKGEDKVLYVLSESKNTIYKYEIGKMEADSYEPITFVELNADNTSSPTSPLLAKFSSYPARLCSDKQGGLWIIGSDPDYISNANAWYRLNHVNAKGEYDFGVADYWGNCNTSLDYFKLSKYAYDIDTNDDGSILTIAVCGSIVPLGVTFDENMKPSLKSPNTSDPTSYIYGPSSTNSPYGRWGNSMHPVTRGVAYDAAGNLYATDLSGYFQAFAPVKADNSYTTPANDLITVSDNLVTGIESVVKDSNAPVEYFNLQGVKVNAPENGVFIKRQGNKVTKVVL